MLAFLAVAESERFDRILFDFLAVAAELVLLGVRLLLAVLVVLEVLAS
jgi:hypothetical protein